MKSAWAGLAAGCLHTLAGPDHLAALTPLTIGRNPLTAGVLGSLWGLGHSSGQLVLGLGMMLANEKFHQVHALLRWHGWRFRRGHGGWGVLWHLFVPCIGLGIGPAGWTGLSPGDP